MNKILIMCFLTILSAIGYRAGGMGDCGRKKFPYLPKILFDTKARDILCGLCVVASFFVLGLHQGVPLWKVVAASVISIPVHLGALSTYWDFILKEDNHWVHGFFCGLSLFPLAYVTGLWIPFAIRAVVVAVLMGAVSTLSGNDNVEEFGRGASLIPTMYIMAV